MQNSARKCMTMGKLMKIKFPDWMARGVDISPTWTLEGSRWRTRWQSENGI